MSYLSFFLFLLQKCWQPSSNVADVLYWGFLIKKREDLWAYCIQLNYLLLSRMEFMKMWIKTKYSIVGKGIAWGSVRLIFLLVWILWSWKCCLFERVNKKTNPTIVMYLYITFVRLIFFKLVLTSYCIVHYNTNM